MTVNLKPVLTNPLVVTLKPSGNPDVINANGRDVELRWPSVPVTDPTIVITGAADIHSIGGHFKPTGADDNSHGALDIRNQVTGGVAYLERMLIDLSGRTHKQAYIHSDPDAIDKIPVTGDAIGFGGVVSATSPTYPSLVMVQSVVKGVSGQHPSGCSTCTSAHADAFQLRGPFDDLTFKDVHVYSTYQGFFVAPANNYYGETVPPGKQQKAGGVITFDNVTATVVKPEGLTAEEAGEWRARASGFYMESYSLRQEGKQSHFNIDIVEPGGIWLEIPASESANAWLNFIAGKTVLHDTINASTAAIEYANPGAILRRVQSPNVPDDPNDGRSTGSVFTATVVNANGDIEQGSLIKSADLETNKVIGIQFAVPAGTDLAAGDVIESAVISWVSDRTHTASSTLTFAVESKLNGAALSTGVTNRSYLPETEVWNASGTWTDGQEITVGIDLANQLNALIQSGGLQAGDVITVKVTGAGGTRYVEAAGGGRSGPELTITVAEDSLSALTASSEKLSFGESAALTDLSSPQDGGDGHGLDLAAAWFDADAFTTGETSHDQIDHHDSMNGQGSNDADYNPFIA